MSPQSIPTSWRGSSTSGGRRPSATRCCRSTAGWSFHVLDGRLRYAHNYVGKSCAVIESDEVVPPGPHQVAMSLFSAGDFRGTATLLVDGRAVGSGEIERLTPVRHSLTGGGIT